MAAQGTKRKREDDEQEFEQAVTITFGDQAENGVGMQMLGELAAK